MSNLKTLLPTLNPYSGQSSAEKLTELQTIVFMLIENIDGALTSIDESNFSPRYQKATADVKEAANKLLEMTKPGQELSQETFQKRFDDLRLAIIDNATEITQLFQSAISQTNEALRAEVSEQYKATGEGMDYLSQRLAEVELSSSQLQLSFSHLEEANVMLDDQLEAFKKELKTYIRFGIEGIELGEVGSPFTALFTKDRLSFYQNRVEIAYFANNKLYVIETETEKLTIKEAGNNYIDITVEGGGLVGRFRRG